VSTALGVGITLGLLLALAFALALRDEWRRRRAERRQAAVERELDELWLTLWVDIAKAKDPPSPRPHDQ
jgi:hypothetical protein